MTAFSMNISSDTPTFRIVMAETGRLAYGESNGHVIDDVTWPPKFKVMTPICLGSLNVTIIYNTCPPKFGKNIFWAIMKNSGTFYRKSCKIWKFY